MKCKNEEVCDGELDIRKGVPLRVGCACHQPAYPCAKCGRLHWHDGKLVVSRSGERVFLEGEELQEKPALLN
ncbi:MAG: hypothetical protein ACOYUZ_01895 [Patescibacteria group bacterium]